MLMTTHLPGRVGFVIYPSVAVVVRELTKEPPKEDKEVESSDKSGAES